jgi:hypothetical protein
MTSKEALKCVFNAIVKYKGCAVNDEECEALTIIQNDIEANEINWKRVILLDDENKRLQKEVRMLERKNKMQKERLEDFADQLGISKSCIL